MKKWMLCGALSAGLVIQSRVPFPCGCGIVEARPNRSGKSGATTALKSSMARFWSAVKADDPKRIVAFFSASGVKLVNTSYQKPERVDKTSYADATQEFLGRGGEMYRALVKGTTRDAVGETHPAFIPVAALAGATWQLKAQRFSPRVGAIKAGMAKDTWIQWAREKGAWRITEIALPYPVFG